MAEVKQSTVRKTDFDSLNTPGRRNRRMPKLDADAFGQFAEWIARFMGSPTFLIWMTVFIVVWVISNLTLPSQLRWDENPFILLTLMLSIEAAYSAPLILLAQNRQEDRDRMTFAEDRRVAAQSRADMDYLAREIASLRVNVGELATRDFVRSEVRDQLRDLLAELEKADDHHAGSEDARPTGH